MRQLTLGLLLWLTASLGACDSGGLPGFADPPPVDGGGADAGAVETDASLPQK